MYGQDEVMVEPGMEVPSEGERIIEGERYNVGEEFTWYDTIAVTENLASLSLQPPGWFATFAALGGATIHSFFNVRNRANCELPYCNLDTRDGAAYGFEVDSITLAFWGSGFSYFEENDAAPPITAGRYWLPNAMWQAQLPFEASLTLRVQQDDKTKLNAMMPSPGYGPIGGGYGNLAPPTGGVVAGTNYPLLSAQTQGISKPQARWGFPNKIGIPRRASLACELNFTQYGRYVLGRIPGPLGILCWEPTWTTRDVYVPVMFAIQCALHGRRLVQQRGDLHA
jgi:hypothetical protein